MHFLPPALIPGFACGMLLYPNGNLWAIAFAAATSIASKVLFRAPVGKGQFQHIFNPSNFGIAATLVLFPQVGFAPPYHFTENVTGIWNWVLPAFILLTGLVIHTFFTGRLPLCAAWIGGFVFQGVLRAWYYEVPLYVPLVPMTSAAFIVFTLYMIPDPATTPVDSRRQALFGLSVAIVYGIIQLLHLVFGLFFALITVCAIRGLALHIWNITGKLPSRASNSALIESLPAAIPARPAAPTV
jgi:enediyne biosynthesis protein E5